MKGKQLSLFPEEENYRKEGRSDPNAGRCKGQSRIYGYKPTETNAGKSRTDMG